MAKALSSGDSNSIKIWHYCLDIDNWIPFEAKLCIDINEALKNGVTTLVIDNMMFDLSILQMFVDDAGRPGGRNHSIMPGYQIAQFSFDVDSPLPRGIIWEWQLYKKSDVWIPYVEAASILLEEDRDSLRHKNNYKAKPVDLRKVGLDYKVDLYDKMQTNISTGFKRKIRRRTAQSYVEDSLNTQINSKGRRKKTANNNEVIIVDSQDSKGKNAKSSGLSNFSAAAVRNLTSWSGSSSQGTHHGSSDNDGVVQIASYCSTSQSLSADSQVGPLQIPQSPSDQPSAPGLYTQSASDHLSASYNPGHSPQSAPRQLTQSASDHSSASHNPGHSLQSAPRQLTQSASDQPSASYNPGHFSHSVDGQPSVSSYSRPLPQLPSDQPSASYNPVQLPQSAITGSSSQQDQSVHPVASANDKFGPLAQFISRTDNIPQDTDCIICFEKLSVASTYDDGSQTTNFIVTLSECGHCFHEKCIMAMCDANTKDGFLECPNCRTLHGIKKGDQPNGHMSHRIINYVAIPGYNCRSAIEISYDIRSGTQGPEHPHPGQRYFAVGFPRIAYLPNNKEGQKVLKLLKVAWDRRLIFTVGRSATSGADDCVVWNDIHHKTELRGNHSGHGYPDPGYLQRVLDELAAHGIQ